MTPPPPVRRQGGVGSSSSKAQWLLSLLDRWLLEMSLGEAGVCRQGESKHNSDHTHNTQG
jgi:hypothetical protein